ncbi:MAG: response regulator [Desulfobacteraceae bacterium]|jgi:CheY-like chemotaxis protein|nr:response regulator [Desulfobacteraceae bacterium]
MEHAAGKFKALVVDDNPFAADAVEVVMKRLGFSVTKAGSGPEAVSCFSHNPYHLVIVDYDMPILNGHRLAYRMKMQNPETRVVIMTGNAWNRAAEVMAENDVDGWLFKPFDLDELLSVLCTIDLFPGNLKIHASSPRVPNPSGRSSGPGGGEEQSHGQEFSDRHAGR